MAEPTDKMASTEPTAAYHGNESLDMAAGRWIFVCDADDEVMDLREMRCASAAD